MDDEDRDDGDPIVIGPRKPSPLELREPLVERGDVAGLYDTILKTPWHELQRGEAFGQLLRAIHVASRQDPSGFSDELFHLMATASSYATLRVQHMLLNRISESDRQTNGRLPEIPRDVLEEYLQHVHLMQGHLAEILQARATTARLWELARQKRLDNDRAEQKGLGVTEAASGPAKPSHSKKNGQGKGKRAAFNNRIAGVSSN
jgi:CRP-like cAMP-binding protein